ncbi:GDSL esterase/lipase At5g42170 isoform X2 [Lactuca sativa]|uniref:GDSL esterase/lipase At5g42170 isoform X2 n=1 Tax=Lactuca sativa TaxID=4236 RepID=UPI001C687531|nr:GDSL esterase/lipase At5g42170 isoform X2 [Lactuca sativa]
MLHLVDKIILFFINVMFYLSSSEGKTNLQEIVSVSAVLAFGDSFVDQGNNNYDANSGKANYAPYGKDLVGGIPTGRFSNGKTLPDFFAEGLGVKAYLPAYLNPFLQDDDLLTGVSFASGGSGYDPITNKFMELYNLGARRIAVFSAPPVGCSPAQRTLFGGILRMCAEKLNEAAHLYNTILKQQLPTIASRLPHSRVAFVDFYNPLIHIIDNPKKYGLEVVNRSCCGTGLIEVNYMCIKHSRTCQDDSKFLFWDNIHLSEIGCNIFVNQSLPGLMDSLL